MSYCDYKLWVQIHMNRSSDELFVMWIGTKSVLTMPINIRIGTKTDVIWIYKVRIGNSSRSNYESEFSHEQILKWVICYVNWNEICFDEAGHDNSRNRNRCDMDYSVFGNSSRSNYESKFTWTDPRMSL